MKKSVEKLMSTFYSVVGTAKAETSRLVKINTMMNHKLNNY